MATDRYLDLLKQGFMKPKKASKPKKAERPIVACDACHDWHRQGKHTAPLEVRKQNLRAIKERRLNGRQTALPQENAL